MCHGLLKELCLEFSQQLEQFRLSMLEYIELLSLPDSTREHVRTDGSNSIVHVLMNILHVNRLFPIKIFKDDFI